MLNFISIIITSYNYADRLPKALHSVFSQSDTSIEVIVIDDGSTDNTSHVVAEFLANNPEVKLSYYEQENQGQAAARNLGVHISQGEYLLFLDADDTLLPDALMPLKEFIIKHPAAEVFIANHMTLFPTGYKKYHRQSILALTPEARFHDFFNNKLSMANGSCVFRRDVFKRISYAQCLRQCEDLAFFVHALTTLNCVLYDGYVLCVHKHCHSLRNRFTEDRNFIEQLAQTIFDPNILPASLMSQRRYFMARRYLSLFKNYLRAKRYKDAIYFYWLAKNQMLKLALQPRYIFKLLRAHLGLIITHTSTKKTFSRRIT